MGKYHLLVFTLVCGSALSASPLVLRMESKFVEDADGPRTVHEWSHVVYAEPSQTTVADETRRKRCASKECVTEEFVTEVTPERIAPNLIQAKVSFHRKIGDETTRIDGVVYARPGEQGEFRVNTTQDTKQRYVMKLTPLIDAKR